MYLKQLAVGQNYNCCIRYGWGNAYISNTGVVTQIEVFQFSQFFKEIKPSLAALALKFNGGYPKFSLISLPEQAMWCIRWGCQKYRYPANSIRRSEGCHGLVGLGPENQSLAV